MDDHPPEPSAAVGRPSKVDLKRELDCYRARRGQVRLLQVPPLQYLMVDGHGDPNGGEEYARALQVLYPLTYALKFASKAAGRDYVVPPLEGLWWADDMASFTTARDKSTWHWTLLLLTPDWLTDAHLAAARHAVTARTPALPVTLARLETLEEGLCVQTLHVGPFDDEAAVLQDLHGRFVPEHGLVLTGRHHEVYLTDPRRTAPDRLRTILRQPVRRAAAPDG